MRAAASMLVLIVLWQSYAGAAQRMEGNDAFAEGNRLYFVEGDFEAALEAYLLVPPDSPDYATAQRYIGYNIYGREWGRWEEGLPYLREAYRVAPDDPSVLEDIGRAYVEVGNDLLGGVDTPVPMPFTGLGGQAAAASIAQFIGADPGAGSRDPRPASEGVASAFDEVAEGLGSVNVITFEALPQGPFESLEVAPGVAVSQTGTTAEGGIVSGCFLDCASEVRRGYNVTPSGEQYLGVALAFEVGTTSLDFSFETPIQAFGTYVIGLGTANGDLTVEFGDGTPQSISVGGHQSGGSHFVGFTAPGAAISRVTLTMRNVRGGSRDNYSIDDVRYAPAN